MLTKKKLKEQIDELNKEIKILKMIINSIK